jgi:hypothetical protein
VAELFPLEPTLLFHASFGIAVANSIVFLGATLKDRKLMTLRQWLLLQVVVLVGSPFKLKLKCVHTIHVYVHTHIIYILYMDIDIYRYRYRSLKDRKLMTLRQWLLLQVVVLVSSL